MNELHHPLPTSHQATLPLVTKVCQIEFLSNNASFFYEHVVCHQCLGHKVNISPWSEGGLPCVSSAVPLGYSIGLIHKEAGTSKPFTVKENDSYCWNRTIQPETLQEALWKLGVILNQLYPVCI